MGANTFGKLFQVHTFGESHGDYIGLSIDGCPAGLEMDMDFIQSEMDKRKPGQSKLVSQRKESDTVQIVSGVFEGKTTGSPIGIIIKNEDAKSKDYSHLKDSFRPSHADFTYEHKYGHRDYRGGGRSSARETACRVAAGAIAKLMLKQLNIEIFAYVDQVASIKMPFQANIDLKKAFIERENNLVRCVDAKIAIEMENLLANIKKSGDTVGGAIQCLIRNVPIGLGEPVFDKLHADLGKAMLSINAVHGFEYGSGFAGIEKKGSEHNDIFEVDHGKVHTKSNHSGGIQGGISNGEEIYFRTAFKPVATIMKTQKSVNKEGEEVDLIAQGRHDPCVVPRAVVIVEAMAALVIADHLLRNKTSKMSDI